MIIFGQCLNSSFGHSECNTVNLGILLHCFTVKPQWLEYPWDQENLFQSKVVLATEGQTVYKLAPRERNEF